MDSLFDPGSMLPIPDQALGPFLPSLPLEVPGVKSKRPGHEKSETKKISEGFVNFNDLRRQPTLARSPLEVHPEDRRWHAKLESILGGIGVEASKGEANEN
ncbi:unnamed protein product [Larinioides sclopetarius]|uniref:Uncharacterized protein n=1 Tax=Larinioides sclopetarius TaxID=280406 RepID=A0AAV1YRS4_9ARAC